MVIYVSAIFTTEQIGLSLDTEVPVVEAVEAYSFGVERPRQMLREYFGGMPESLFTLFQIVTLESWANGVRGFTGGVVSRWVLEYWGGGSCNN